MLLCVLDLFHFLCCIGVVDIGGGGAALLLIIIALQERDQAVNVGDRYLLITLLNAYSCMGTDCRWLWM
jgi:hypothetical protein